MRGVVAALRASPPRVRPPLTRHERSRWKTLMAAFFVGVVVGALTLIALTRSM
jgi:hypothetical protein